MSGSGAILRRRAAEGSPKVRKRQLNRVYRRDGARCFYCRGYVPRDQASREHLYPVCYFPELARDDWNVFLVHKECNR